MTRLLFACFLGALATGCVITDTPQNSTDLDARYTLGDGGVSEFYTFAGEI